MKAYKITFKTDVVYGSMIWNFLYGYEIWYYLVKVTNNIDNRVITWEIILNYIEEFDVIDNMINGIKPIISELEVKLIIEYDKIAGELTIDDTSNEDIESSKKIEELRAAVNEDMMDNYVKAAKIIKDFEGREDEIDDVEFENDEEGEVEEDIEKF